ncbi:energy-coupling factor transporter transmembrane component T [Brooklawnia cerclae]|uniref:Energy-coupling factor transport system permease protein n=1 Tax=Brooklawnia cerclae TaxID=349934 RepID=A0ABX0SNZ1_9ACTN|nr:energy-coupling factor transport system permease protein [Brooklawnia cerclae]
MTNDTASALVVPTAVHQDEGTLRPPSRVRFWTLDPRTKLLALLVVNALVLGTGPFVVTVAAAVVAAVLLASVTTGAAWRVYLAVFAAGTACFFLASDLLPNGLGALLTGGGFWFARFSVSLALAGYVLASTGATELAAALRALGLPRAVVIPFSVMLRFIPTVVGELRAITDAIRLRGLVPTTSSLLVHPVRTAEFILVPLLSSTSRMADDLSASAIIRGLGSERRPTSIVRLRFSRRDAAMVVVLAGLVALRISGWRP